MDYSTSTALITGGASGIGFALARRLRSLGATVVVCGRRREQLQWAEHEAPGIRTLQCDIALQNERERLFSEVTSQFPALNVLINNAGIQHRPPPVLERQDWGLWQREIATNLEAPMHLSSLFAPHLSLARQAAIVNVSSGLAFSPISFMPGYCATKAALHSFTLSLRHQLRHTSVSVVEIIPPKTNTDLGGKGLHEDGAPLEEYADATFARLLAGEEEIGYGFSEFNRKASREQLNQIFTRLNPS